MHRFDPLSLASEEKALTWFQQAELVHCRTAMAAVAGIVIPGVCVHAIAFAKAADFAASNSAD